MKLPMGITVLLSIMTLLAAPDALELRDGDMKLNTENNVLIVLHKDLTWELADPKAEKPKGDFTVTLSGNRVIKIFVYDNSWRYLEKDEIHEAENLPLSDITVSSSMTHAVLSEANARATDKAVTLASSKLRPMLQGKKVNIKKLMECMKRVEKDVQKKEDFKEGRGWTVSLVMTLDRGSLLAVVDCEAGREEAAGKE